MQYKTTLIDILFRVYETIYKWNGYPSFLFKQNLATVIESFKDIELSNFAIYTSEYLNLQKNPINSACIDILYSLRKLIFDNINIEEFKHFIIKNANKEHTSVIYIPFMYIIGSINNKLSHGNVENLVPDMNSNMETYLSYPKNKIPHKILYRNFSIEAVFDFDWMDMTNSKFSINKLQRVYKIANHYTYSDMSMVFLAYYEMEDRLLTTVDDTIGEV